MKPPRRKRRGFLYKKRRNPPKPPLHVAGTRKPPFLVRPKGRGFRAKAGEPRTGRTQSDSLPRTIWKGQPILRTNVTPPFRKSVKVGILIGLATLVAGCGVQGPEPPKRPPTTAEIKGWSDHRIVVIEKSIRDKDYRLPSRVSGLIRYLRGLSINVTVGPGQKFQNTQEAVDALNGVIARLAEWFDESRNRPKGDSDEDRAQLQAILSETKDILKNVKVTEGTP